MLDHHAADPEVDHELGVQTMTDIRPGIADGKANFLQRRAAPPRSPVRLRWRPRSPPLGRGRPCCNRVPLVAKRGFNVARLTPVTIRRKTDEIRARGRRPVTRMIAAFETRNAPMLPNAMPRGAAIPNRRKGVLQSDASLFEDEEEIPAHSVVGAANQRQFACPAAMRACAIRTASTPADSSPKNVRAIDDA